MPEPKPYRVGDGASEGPLRCIGRDVVAADGTYIGDYEIDCSTKYKLMVANARRASFADLLKPMREWAETAIARCPDCHGTGYDTYLDPNADGVTIKEVCHDCIEAVELLAEIARREAEITNGEG